MSRFVYTAVLFVMTAIGFGEFKGSLSERISTAKDKTIEANRAKRDATQGVELASKRPRPTAVAGVRG